MKNSTIKIISFALVSLVFVWAAASAKTSKSEPLVTHVDRAPFYTGFETPLTKVFYVGQQLDVVREASHPYDPNLLALYDGEFKVGYVPVDATDIVLARMLSSSTTALAVVEIDPDRPWDGVKVAFAY